ncbi:hypothetical protein GCM10011390_30100 [Aureimonas endophytica]|uniref:histidine kinase n=1 Tax=Aureimonas endophytica TaxID=2027858 RepID=A0A916ZQA6_9HYPH|nr:PAS domain S-box protein [Aureimonas endophytica]GGE09013.1 hypothetical protein GCM10011390_30100 [Aureimonas endophytica]
MTGRSETGGGPSARGEGDPLAAIGASPMAAAIRAHDWTDLGLGRREDWPAGVAALVALMLESRQPMFLLWGAEHRLVYNDAYVALLGAKHPAALGRPFLDVWREARDPLAALVERVFAGHPAYRDDIRLDLDRGEGLKEAHFAFSLSPIRDAAGAVGGLFCVCTETTATVLAQRRQRLAEERLRESEDNYRHAVELSPQIAWTTQGDGTVDQVSIRWRDLTGLAHTGTSWLDALHPEDRPRAREAWRRSLAEGRPLWLEMRARMRSGDYRWFLSRAYPRFGADGAILRWYGTTEDIHERKIGEEYLRSIIETVPDAMIVTDAEGTVRSFSQAAERCFGYRAEEVIGANVRLLLPERHRAVHAAALGRHRPESEGGKGGEAERVIRGRRKDGTTFPMSLSIGEIRTGTERVFASFIRDLTEKRQAEKRVEEMQAELLHMSRFTALGEMASALAHELNQPLTAISNYLGACRRLVERAPDGRGAEPEDLLARAIADAAGQAKRAGEIIRALRAFAGRSEGRRQREALPKLLDEASALALVGTRDADIALRIEIDPAVRVVIADRVQIQQVVVNLMRNAIEAMQGRPHRELRIVARPAAGGTHVEILVEDTGPGLPPEIAAKLFQPFHTTKPNGMGVGLSICRGIVEGHGGRIAAEANEAGGTTFRFTVPCPPAEGRTHAA